MHLTLASLDDPDFPNIAVIVPLPYFDLGDGHTSPDKGGPNAIDRAALYPAPVAQQSHGLHAFTYGYAITTHKAQGSEWPNTLVIDQSFIFRDTQWQHLYTAITRAQNHATIICYF